MAVTFVGYNTSRRPINVGSLSGGSDTTPSDGDWIFWITYYRNTETVTFDDSTGWTQLRKTIGSVGTIELWRYHWSTGDPTTWTMSHTGVVHDGGFSLVFRGLIATPTIISATHETTTSPAIADAITDGAIGNNDLALVFCSCDGTSPSIATPSPSTGSSVVAGGAEYAGVSANWICLTVGGAAPAVSTTLSPTTTTEAFGLQLVLPDVPIPTGGWGVGQVRMGTN